MGVEGDRKEKLDALNLVIQALMDHEKALMDHEKVRENVVSQEKLDLLIFRLIEAVRTLTADNHSYLATFVLDVVLMLLEGKKE